MARRILSGLTVTIVSCLMMACGSATVSGQREVGAAPQTRPTAVYVTDFQLDAQNLRSESGPPLPPPPPGPLGGILPPPPGAPKDPAVRARELIELMSTSLVQESTKAGLNARRLRAGDSPPDVGWLVRGIFTQVDEGNRLHRAVIGFGAGQTELQLVVAIDDLAQGTPKPFYELDTSATSGKAPGAVITLNPYVAIAKFALSSRDLEQNVKQAAAKIASDVASRVSSAGGPSR
jgi:hypothetical protein